MPSGGILGPDHKKGLWANFGTLMVSTLGAKLMIKMCLTRKTGQWVNFGVLSVGGTAPPAPPLHATEWQSTHVVLSNIIKPESTDQETDSAEIFSHGNQSRTVVCYHNAFQSCIQTTLNCGSVIYFIFSVHLHHRTIEKEITLIQCLYFHINHLA